MGRGRPVSCCPGGDSGPTGGHARGCVVAEAFTIHQRGGTVHILHEGRPLCGFMESGTPSEWPDGHSWISVGEASHAAFVNIAALCPNCDRARLRGKKINGGRRFQAPTRTVDQLELEELARDLKAFVDTPIPRDSGGHPAVAAMGDMKREAAELARKVEEWLR
jgi:hypothetical protein